MSDKGFAPNPYHGYCTLAACTPNHMGAQLFPGDMIAGFFTDNHRPHLVYYMTVDQVLDLNSYYHDRRFSKKKPQLAKGPEMRCGDNIYHKGLSGVWIRDKGPFHQRERDYDQDTRYAKVYIAKSFGYFGCNAYRDENALPKNLRGVLKKGQGIKYTKAGDLLFDEYFKWLNSRPEGINGEPRDMEIASAEYLNKCKN